MKSLALVAVLVWCRLHSALAVEVPLSEPCPSGGGQPMKKLVCYYEGVTSVDKINPCLCTHVVFTAAARVADDFTLQLVQDVEHTSRVLRRRNPALRLVLTVGCAAAQSDALSASSVKRQQLVRSVATLVAEADVDGVELDFRMSTQGGGADAKESFAEFVKLLREKIDGATDEGLSRQKRDYSVTEDQDDDSTTEWSTKRNSTATTSKKSSKSTATTSRRRKSKVSERDADAERKIVFVRVPIQPEVIAKRFDLKYIAKYIDNFIVATDNITDASETGVTYHPSRLMGLADILNMDSMLDLLTGLGAPHSQLIVSIPAATTLFTLEDAAKTTPRSPVIGLPTTINQAKMCSLLAEGGWTVERDEDLTAPYAFRNDTWMAFEDKTSAGIKGKYVVLRDLGGAAVYRLDDEDSTGGCRNVSQRGDSSLLESLHYAFTNLARKSRQALLQTLQEEIHESSLVTYSGDVHLSPYRIVRVVDLAGAVHVVRKDAKTEFECSRQGYFSHPLGCNRFYRCVKFNQYSPEYTVFEYDCPAGLAFDERWEVCVWPGSLPHGSPCTGSSEIAPVPRARYSCPAEEGYYADPENCRWFFACLDHARDGSPPTAYEFRCPFGLVFDEQKLLCDWPWSVAGCGASGKAGFAGAFGFSAHSASGSLRLDAAAAYQSNSAAYGHSSYAASSSSSSEAFGNGGAGYIAGGAAAGSYYEGRDTASYATFPDYLVSGGRIEQSSGVVLGEHVEKAAGIAGVVGYAGGNAGVVGYAGGYGSVAPAAPVLADVRAAVVTSHADGGSRFVAGGYGGAVYQATPSPVVGQVEFYAQSTPRPAEQVFVEQAAVSKQEFVSLRQPIVEKVVVKQPVVEQQVFYQSTPRPIVQQVELQQSIVKQVPIVQQEIVQQPQVFYQSTPRPIVKQVQYQTPIVQQQIVQGPQVFYQSTPRPIVKQVQYQTPIVQQQIVQEPQVFYQSTPRPIVKQVQYQTPIVQQQIVQEPQVFYQSTPRPIVKQVQYQTPIVQQPLVSYREPQIFFQSTPRPIVKQVQYQTPIIQQQIVQEPQVFYQSTPRPIVKQVQYQAPIVKKVEYQTPIIQQEIVHEPQVFYQSTPRPIIKQVQYQAPIVKQQIVQEPQVFYQSTPRPIVKQVQYQTPVVQQQIIQEPVIAYNQPVVQQPLVSYREPQIFFQSTPRPIVKQVQYQTPIVQQQIVHEPQVFYQSTPRPIVKQVQYQAPIVQQEIVQEPQVFYQSTPRPIVKQVQYQAPIVKKVEYQTPIIQQEIIQEPQVFYQSTPRPIVKQVQYQAPIVQQEIVQEPQVFYQSTPRPIVKQVQYQAPIVKQQIVQEPQVFYQSTPRPIVKQVQYQAPIVKKVEYQTPIIQQEIIQEPQVFYQSTPRPIVKQVQYQTPIVQKQIVQEPQVFYQSTPRPIVKQVQYQTPIVQKQIVQEPQVFYQSTPRPIVKQVQYQAPVVQQQIVQEPQVFYQSTPKPIVKQVQYQQPIVEQKFVQQPQPQVYYQPTPRPVVKQVQYQEPIIQQIVQTPKPTVYYSQTSPAPVVKQVTFRPQYQQVVKQQTYIAPTAAAVPTYSYDAVLPVSTAQPSRTTSFQQQRYEARQQAVSVSDNGEYGNINQAPLDAVQVTTPSTQQRYETAGDKAQAYDAYTVQGQAQQSWTSYDSRYDAKQGMAQFVNDGLTDFAYADKYEESAEKNEGKYEEQYEEKYEQREQEVYVEKATPKPLVVEQYFRETSPPKLYTTTGRPATYAAPDYLPPSPSTPLEATTFRYEQRTRAKIAKQQRVVAEVDALLDQDAGVRVAGVRVGGANDGFVSDVIADDLAGKLATTSGYVEVTTFRPRKKSRKRPTSTTTASYEEDDDAADEVEIKKSNQPIVVVTQVSDANPLLIAKLGAKCTCQSERVSLRKKSRNRGDGDAGDVPVVRVRPAKRPTVSRVPVDVALDSLLAKTRRPDDADDDAGLPSVADLEQRYVKSGLRTPGLRYRKPKIPVVIDFDNDADADDDQENDAPSATLRPIVVEGPSAVLVSTRRPAANVDLGRFPQEKSIRPIVVREPFTLVTRRPYVADGQASNVAFAPEAPRRRPENARRRPVQVAVEDDDDDDDDDNAAERDGRRRRPEVARRRPAGGDDDVAARGGARRAGAGEGGTVRVAGKSFDRYGPGGWRSVDETLQGSVDCQRPGLFRHPRFCNKFYACHWDNWKSRYTLAVFNCPVHLSYDTSLGACNWPTKGPACVDDNLLV